MAGKVSVGPEGRGIAIGGESPLAFICGPCVIESRDHALFMAENVARIRQELALPIVFKSSYDKANRTSAGSFRGVGLQEGLKILQEIQALFSMPVVTDVHSEEEAAAAAEVVDLLQIPAFLCRQTSLLLAAGRSGKPVMVKKGQFLHPQDMAYASDKIKASGNSQVIFCERGSCFGYRDLVVDFRSLSIMSELGCPVVFDATHSVQVIGGAGGASGGNRKYVPMLARAAVAAGVDALFFECHDNPVQAPSDGPNMVPLDALPSLLADLCTLKQAYSSCIRRELS